jgi:lysophospholipase L1-like esterase
MKHIFKKFSTLALFSGSLLLSSCDPEIEAPAISKGELDLSKYIAVGNSLTAGYMDNGLYREGQLSSYPNILAGQFRQVGGGEFVQPLFTEAQRNGSGYLRLAGFTPTGSPIIAGVTTELGWRNTNTAAPLYTKFTDPINNLGVPGIAIAHIKLPGYGSTQGNPYFERITPDNAATQTYLARVQASAPTFFSLWLGNNDVLGYATAGGFAGALTADDLFTANYTELVNTLTANNTKGIAATIPDVTGIPFFNTVGPQVKALLTARSVPGMVALTKNTRNRVIIPTPQIKDAAGGAVLFTLTSAAYAPLIGQPTGKYWRDLAKSQNPANWQLQLAGYLLNFAIDSTQAFGVSSGNPMPSALLLDEVEINEVRTATNNFNTVIRNQAQAKNLALFDAHAFFNSIQLQNGQPTLNMNGVAYSPAFITGNLFSLDGVHPTPRGYAIIANEMIKAINGKYQARIPTVDVTQYRAVLFP